MDHLFDNDEVDDVIEKIKKETWKDFDRIRK
jgi:hypothetical protein